MENSGALIHLQFISSMEQHHFVCGGSESRDIWLILLPLWCSQGRGIEGGSSRRCQQGGCGQFGQFGHIWWGYKGALKGGTQNKNYDQNSRRKISLGSFHAWQNRMHNAHQTFCERVTLPEMKGR